MLRLAPLRPGQQYVRCGTVWGTERGSTEISADHRRLAVLTNGGTVRLLSTESLPGSLNELVELASPVGTIDAVGFSPDGSTLATVSAEAGQLALWDANDGRLLRSYFVRPGSLATVFPAEVAFSADGRRVVTHLQTVTDLETGETTDWSGSTVGPQHRVGAALDRGSMQLALDDEMVVIHYVTWESGAQSFNHLEWSRPRTGEWKSLYYGRTDRALSFALSPDEHLLALGADQLLRTYAIGRDEPLASLTGYGEVLAFSLDEEELYAASSTEIVALATHTLAKRRSFPRPDGARFLGRAPSGQLVFATKTETIWWDATEGKTVRSLPMVLFDLHWSADGEQLVATSKEAWLVVARATDLTVLARVPVRTAVLPTLPSVPGPAPWDANPPFDPFDAPEGVPAVLRQYGQGHWMATDWSQISVIDRVTRKTLRTFHTTDRAYADISSDGEIVRTYEGWYLAVWCR